MNIGEISKPSVDKTQLKRKVDVTNSEPVSPVRKVVDEYELSEEGKKRQEDEELERIANLARPESTDQHLKPSNKPHIDSEAVVRHIDIEV